MSGVLTLLTDWGVTKLLASAGANEGTFSAQLYSVPFGATRGRHGTDGTGPFGVRNGNLREKTQVRTNGKRLNGRTPPSNTSLLHQKFSITAATSRVAKSCASRSSAGSCSSKKSASVAELTWPELGFTTMAISYSFRNRKLSV